MPIAVVIAALAVVGCGSVGRPPDASAAASATQPVPGASAGTSVGASADEQSPPPSDPSESSPPAGGGALLLCDVNPVDPSSTDIDCRDAIDAALLQAVGGSPVTRAELRWARLCPAASSCPPDVAQPNQAFVVLHLADRTGADVPVRLENGGLVAGPARLLSEADIGQLPSFSSPAASRPDVGPAPPAVGDRPPLPFCGSEHAGLAGPFNTAGRRCFLDSVLAGEPAEFLSNRADVGGEPFVEVWRSRGAGPVTVLLGQSAHWSELTCALTILGSGDQLFDHTDCSTSPIA